MREEGASPEKKPEMITVLLSHHHGSSLSEEALDWAPGVERRDEPTI